MASVLARPGTPSSRMCPFESSPMSSVSTRCFWPTITLPISMFSVSTNTLSRSMRSLSSLMLITSLILYCRLCVVRNSPPRCPERPPGREVRARFRQPLPAQSAARCIKILFKRLTCKFIIKFSKSPAAKSFLAVCPGNRGDGDAPFPARIKRPGREDRPSAIPPERSVSLSPPE